MTKSDIGLIGLGTMGAALTLNIAEEGFDVAVNNRTASKMHDLKDKAGDLAPRITICDDFDALIAALKPPRAILLMVPSGEVVDDHIDRLRPLLDADDILIDAGNANFHDTVRRAKADPAFLGIGVSGGEEGARHGPSIMGGGPRTAWDRVAPILTAIAADHEGTPCATWMGEDGAGHFVKTVHNGIEYADMQMIAEIYGILRDGHGDGADAIARRFKAWNEGPLHSYLVEITGKIAATDDPETGKPMLDVIQDRAGQKGTGRWTAVEAQHLGAPIAVIEAAVAARNLSALKEERQTAQDRFGAAPTRIDPIDDDTLECALIAGKIICYAQGFDLLSLARQKYGWHMELPEVARVWRAGCIIRSAMLDDMADALTDAPAVNLILAPSFAETMEKSAPCLRHVVVTAQAHGLPIPALSSALSYFDALRTARGTANMIQAQRDFFGRHGFERVDSDESDLHGPWVA